MKMDRAAVFCMEHIEEMVLFFDGKGTISYANKKAKTITEYGEAIESVPIEAVFPGIREALDRLNPHEDCAKGRPAEVALESLMYATDMYRKNKTCFPVSVRLFPYPAEEAFCCIAADATEQSLLLHQNEKAKREADAAYRVKAEFVANITHELRTPVNGILGSAKLLLDRETDAEKRRTLSLIGRSCSDMNAIISNILDFSKLEAGKFELEPRRFRFRDMIDYVTAAHRNRITGKGLDFFVSVAPEIPEELIGDELRLTQILNNLLSNAFKFTSVGRIALSVVQASKVNEKIELFFMVSDTGIGIDKEGQDKLFISFSQVEASTSRRFGGTGLGLTITKQLVELMDGDIHVESVPQEGTVFSFHIWLTIPKEEQKKQQEVLRQNEKIDEKVTALPKKFFPVQEVATPLFTFGTKENLAELAAKSERLILCVEMENWEKAEMFADGMRRLTQTAPREVKKAVLRLKMAVQKADYDSTETAYEQLTERIDAIRGNGNGDA